MVPYIPDGSVVYVNRDPLKAGDVGIFCVDGDIFCKQYYKDPAGTVYLFSLNRARADADVVLTAGSGRTLACFGRVILHAAAAGADVTESRAPPMRRPALLFGSLQTMNPPSAARICPVRKDALSEARKATAWATSSGVPSRPRGVCSARSRRVSCPRT